MQVDRYRLLLGKQRDIMVALTARLNQRDEQILKIQEELDAYDHHQQYVHATTEIPLYCNACSLPQSQNQCTYVMKWT